MVPLPETLRRTLSAFLLLPKKIRPLLPYQVGEIRSNRPRSQIPISYPPQLLNPDWSAAVVAA